MRQDGFRPNTSDKLSSRRTDPVLPHNTCRKRVPAPETVTWKEDQARYESRAEYPPRKELRRTELVDSTVGSRPLWTQLEVEILKGSLKQLRTPFAEVYLQRPPSALENQSLVSYGERSKDIGAVISISFLGGKCSDFYI